MDPWSKVELLTHHTGGGQGDVEASVMVFFLRQGAGIGTVISSRDRNHDGGGTELGFEKRVPSWVFLLQEINIGERGGQEVAPSPQAVGGVACLVGTPGSRPASWWVPSGASSFL